MTDVITKLSTSQSRLDLKQLLVITGALSLLSAGMAGAVRADDSDADDQAQTTKTPAKSANPANQTYDSKRAGQAAPSQDAQEAKLLQGNPALASVIKKGYSELQTGKYEQSVKSLMEAVKLNNQSTTARRYLAYALLRSGQPANAVQQLLALSRLSRPSLQDLDIFGEAYLAEGSYEQARDSFKDAINMNDGYTAAHAGLIRAYTMMQEYDSAKKHAEEQIKKTKDPATQRYFQDMIDQVQKMKDNGGTAPAELGTPTTKPEDINNRPIHGG